MKKYLFLLLISNLSFSQNDTTVIDEKIDYEILELPFAVIEDVPVFPGCEGVIKSERATSFLNELEKHFNKHLTYPAEAIEKNIKGRINVEFIIDREGNIVNIQTSKGNLILQNEVKRIISLLPKMKPGKHGGIIIRVKFNTSFTFK